MRSPSEDRSDYRRIVAESALPSAPTAMPVQVLHAPRARVTFLSPLLYWMAWG